MPFLMLAVTAVLVLAHMLLYVLLLLIKHGSCRND